MFLLIIVYHFKTGLVSLGLRRDAKMTDSTVPAACVLLLRPGAPKSNPITSGDFIEVYIARRDDALAFLGGFDVFPGGKVDPEDHNTPVHNWPAAPSQADDGEATTQGINMHLSWGNPGQAVAAVRELFEETGVLVADGADALTSDTRNALRRSLDGNGDGNGDGENRPDWPGQLRAHGLTINASKLTPISRWTTPAFMPIRFHAVYYAAWLPAGQAPEIWPGELTHGGWFGLDEALKAHRDGDLFLSYPVLETLRAMIAVFKTTQGQTPAPQFDLGPLAPQVSAKCRGPATLSVGGEMTAGVHILPLQTNTLPPATHTNTYILGGRDLIVVDPSGTEPQEQARLAAYLGDLVRAGGILREIWLTHEHRDHICGTKSLLKEFGTVPLCAHPLTAAALPDDLKITRSLKDGDLTEIWIDDGEPAQWRAIHTPGHARGHLCFFEQKSRGLLTGDMVLGLGTVLIDPPDGDMVAYLDSLQRLYELEPGFLFPGHGPTVAASRRRIIKYIEHRLTREAAIVAFLDTAAPDFELTEVVRAVYGDVDELTMRLALRNVVAHLIKLSSEGQKLSPALKKALR